MKVAPGAFVQPAELVAHLLAQPLVKAGQRLVEKQDARLHHQCPGERDALPLAAGHHADLARTEATELDQFQRILDLLREICAFQPA